MVYTYIYIYRAYSCQFMVHLVLKESPGTKSAIPWPGRLNLVGDTEQNCSASRYGSNSAWGGAIREVCWPALERPQHPRNLRNEVLRFFQPKSPTLLVDVHGSITFPSNVGPSWAARCRKHVRTKQEQLWNLWVKPHYT